MKSTIYIKGKPFEYESVYLTSDTAPVITFDQAKNILFETKKRFDEKGISFFMIFGTLLGVVRENNFISHDYDVDIATGDYEKMLEFIPEWYEQGFKICRHNDVFLSFMIDGVYIDVYRYQKTAPLPLYKYWCCKIDNCIMPKKFFKSFKTVDFLGGEFLIPERSEDLLKWIYGETWRIPIKGKHGIYNVRSIHYFKKTRQYLSQYIGRKKLKKIYKKIKNQFN